MLPLHGDRSPNLLLNIVLYQLQRRLGHHRELFVSRMRDGWKYPSKRSDLTSIIYIFSKSMRTCLTWSECDMLKQFMVIRGQKDWMLCEVNSHNGHFFLVKFVVKTKSMFCLNRRDTRLINLKRARTHPQILVKRHIYNTLFVN